MSEAKGMDIIMKRFLLMLFLVIFTVSIILIGVGCKEKAAESATQETTTTEEVTQESKEPEIDTADTTPPTKELQWRWQNPLPDGNTLNSAWCSSPTDAFAVDLVKGLIK